MYPPILYYEDQFICLRAGEDKEEMNVFYTSKLSSNKISCMYCVSSKRCLRRNLRHENREFVWFVGTRHCTVVPLLIQTATVCMHVSSPDLVSQRHLF